MDRRLELYLGMTATHAWGSLTQPPGAGFLNGTSQDDAASGLGPAFTARVTPLRAGDLEFSLDGSAGVILYDGRFPAGGDIYNFMFRAGPRFGLALDQRTSLFLKYQWMHVSNGQGLGPWNPSYEGEGPVAGLNWGF